MQSYVRGLVIVVVYLWISQFLVLAAIQRPGNDYPKAQLPDMVDGTGHKPFVLRTLLPSAVRWIALLTPESVRQEVQGRLGRAELFTLTPASDEHHVYLYLLAYVLEGLSIFGWLIVLRSGLKHFYGDRGVLTDLLPLIAGLLLPCLLRYVHYDYDFPQLFIFSLGLLLLYRRNWLIYYPVLLLAALSKETALLLVAVHLLTAGGLRRRELLTHAAAQLALVIGVRAVLQGFVFADNPGDPVEVYWRRNLEWLIDPDQFFRIWFWIAPVGGYAVYLPTSCNVLFTAGVPLLFWRWSDKPSALRQSLWLAPLLFGLTLVMGQVDEVRVYYELVPILFWLGMHSVLIVPSTSRAIVL